MKGAPAAASEARPTR